MGVFIVKLLFANQDMSFTGKTNAYIQLYFPNMIYEPNS